MISTGQFPVKEFVVYLTIYNNEINNLVSDFRNMVWPPVTLFLWKQNIEKQ